MSGEIEAAPMCFACGEDNPIGLNIRFEVQGDQCSGIFTPNENHVGFSDTVHGGIIYTALDDVTANILYQQGRKAHTAKCEIRYRQPARVGEKLMIKGWVEAERRRLIILKGEIRRAADDVVVAECESSFMLEKV
jgi:acyl-coenzyme A thioesterase PaaI-like protein